MAASSNGDGRHDAAVLCLIAQAKKAASTAHRLASDAVAADLIGLVLQRTQREDHVPGSVHHGFMNALLWITANGSKNDEDFLAAVLAFQTVLGAHAANGRDAALRAGGGG